MAQQLRQHEFTESVNKRWTAFPESASEPPALGIWNRADIDPDCKSVRRWNPPRATRASEWEREEIRRLTKQGFADRSIARRLALTEGAVREALKGRN